ncbi:MAG: carbohydrate kinase family protein [Candidatus Sumerlaeia bacterium]|nr:carbohydrate kinase family protein [Candidatus Sumerlaeia bacterium]
MGPIIVAGITNIETSLAVEGFPVDYAKSRFVFHGVRDRIGGVGYNVGRALAHLGARVELATMLGRDRFGAMLEGELRATPGLGCAGVLRAQERTLRSVIAVDPAGRGAMFTDLKDSQETAYPRSALQALLPGAGILHASNINWAYDLALAAKEAGVRVCTDVQAIGSLDEPYNTRFLHAADIVLFSGENLRVDAAAAVRRLWDDFDVRLAVCTLGAEGALLGDRSERVVRHFPAVPLRAPRNVTGAGDAFAAGFLAALQGSHTPEEAVLRGQLVAGYRIGEEGDDHGLPPRELLEAEYARRR